MAESFYTRRERRVVHNEIWINAPAKVIWTKLVNATISLRFP
jgi:hypothetical protein